MAVSKGEFVNTVVPPSWLSATGSDYRGYTDRENERWEPLCTLPKLSDQIRCEIPRITATNKILNVGAFLVTDANCNPYNPGPMSVVHFEDLLSFHHLPLFNDESSSFSETWPSLHNNFAQRETLWAVTHSTLYGGSGKGIVKLSKYAKRTITSD